MAAKRTTSIRTKKSSLPTVKENLDLRGSVKGIAIHLDKIDITLDQSGGGRKTVQIDFVPGPEQVAALAMLQICRDALKLECPTRFRCVTRGRSIVVRSVAITPPPVAIINKPARGGEIRPKRAK